jgi:PHP family Zn ribbon phosphoesterase
MNQHSSNPLFDFLSVDPGKQTKMFDFSELFITADGNSAARVNERSFLYFLTVFDPYDQESSATDRLPSR